MCIRNTLFIFALYVKAMFTIFVFISFLLFLGTCECYCHYGQVYCYEMLQTICEPPGSYPDFRQDIAPAHRVGQPSSVPHTPLPSSTRASDYCKPYSYVWLPRYNLHLCVYPYSMDMQISATFLNGRIHDQIAVDMVSDFLRNRNHSIVIDVGANLGIFSLVAAKQGHYVLAFEASPETAAIMWKSVQLNHLEDNIELYCNGLGDYNRIASLVIDTVNRGGTYLTARRKGGVNDNDHVFIDITTLDDFIPRILHHGAKSATGEVSVSFLKIDVDGDEARVMSGAAELLQRFTPEMMYIEIATGSNNPLQTQPCNNVQLLYILQKYMQYNLRPRLNDSIKDVPMIPVQKTLQDMRVWFTYNMMHKERVNYIFDRQTMNK